MLNKTEKAEACTCDVCQQFLSKGVDLQKVLKEVQNRDYGTVAESLSKIHYECVHFIDPGQFDVNLQYDLLTVADLATAFKAVREEVLC